jgi:hypothetical protein
MKERSSTPPAGLAGPDGLHPGPVDTSGRADGRHGGAHSEWPLGDGKRWLSVWHDDVGQERSKAFSRKDAADRYWQAMEIDRERGEYLDPKAGRELVRDVGKRWLASRVTDPATQIRYESLWRLHVEPAFGRRRVKAVMPSEIGAWLARLGEEYGSSTAAGAYLFLQG